MMPAPPRLLYLPNEPVLGWQTGPRRYFEEATESGELAAYEAFSFEFEAAKAPNDETVCRRIYEIAERFQPDIILWQHIANFRVSREFLRQLKTLTSQPTLVYHEADMYGSLRDIKTPSKSMKFLAAEADLTFVVGLGKWAAQLKTLGADDVRYAPHFYDPALFGSDWKPSSEREWDVVLIGNRVASRIPIPGRAIPGATKREELAYQLHRSFGDRFGLFGRGWEKTGFCHGALNFEDQEKVLRNSWLSVIWDHFDETPFYFSDRLPISLASGVLHMTNYHQGYDAIFSNGQNIVYCRSVRELVETAETLLAGPKENLVKIGTAGQEFARNRLTADIVMGDMLREIVDYKHRLSPSPDWKACA